MAINTTGQTLTQNTAADAVIHIACGSDQFDATVVVAVDSVRIFTGFRPKYVFWENMTNGNGVYYIDGVPENKAMWVPVGGPKILGFGITVHADGFEVTQNAPVPVIASSSLCCWLALG